MSEMRSISTGDYYVKVEGSLDYIREMERARPKRVEKQVGVCCPTYQRRPEAPSLISWLRRA